MKWQIPVISVCAFAAIWLFGYMRNRQADRNDQRRIRLEEKQEELLELLRKDHTKKKKKDTDDN